MNFRLLPAALLVFLTIPSSNTLTLQPRKYVLNEVDKYVYTISMEVEPLGSVDLMQTFTQTVKKVHANGNAEIELAVKDIQTKINGEIVKSDVKIPPPQVRRYDSMGVEIDSKKPYSRAISQINKYWPLIVGKPLEVGKDIPIDMTDPKSPNTKTTGFVRLVSADDGIAEIQVQLTVTGPELDKPLKTHQTSLIEIRTSKTLRSNGTISGLAQEGIGAQNFSFTVERKS